MCRMGPPQSGQTANASRASWPAYGSCASSLGSLGGSTRSRSRRQPRDLPRFFYGVTLGCGAILERIAYARGPRKLPAVLSADEVVRFLEAVSSLKARIALTTAYAAGLRVSEVIGLKGRYRQ
jgi:integrase